MPSFTFVQYNGTDDQILELVKQLLPVNAAANTSSAQANSAQQASSPWRDIAIRFARHISATSAGGRSGQRNAMLLWLKSKDGEVDFTKLWKAAGVKRQHDYSGVGGSLTKNMIKSGGPKEWYSWHQNGSGRWIYKLLPELLEPLRDAFQVK